jgi:O-methyltransferase
VKRRIKTWLAHRGYALVRHQQQPSPYPSDSIEFINRVAGHTMLSPQRLASLYDQVRFLEEKQLAGALVQCGVWRGGSAGVLALTNLAYGSQRRSIHLFDTFAGIPEPDIAVDGDRAINEALATGVGTTGKLQANPQMYTKMGRPVGQLDDCRSLLEDTLEYPAAYLHYHVGFFQQTLPAAACALGPIALLHLDGDWYASTKVCLETLYGQVIQGGLIVIDDYGAYEGCRRAVDEFLAQQDLKIYMHPVDHEAVTFVKP